VQNSAIKSFLDREENKKAGERGKVSSLFEGGDYQQIAILIVGLKQGALHSVANARFKALTTHVCLYPTPDKLKRPRSYCVVVVDYQLNIR